MQLLTKSIVNIKNLYDDNIISYRLSKKKKLINIYMYNNTINFNVYCQKTKTVLIGIFSSIEYETLALLLSVNGLE